MAMKRVDQLRAILYRIDGRGYKAYKDLEGSYDFGHVTLHIDHVQGDPFASPSKIRLRVPMDLAGFPQTLFSNKVRKFAFEDYVARQVQKAIMSVVQKRQGSGKSGIISIDSGGQEVLERTACKVTSSWLEARIYVGLPAAGRRILGRQAEAMLCNHMPRIVEQGLHWKHFTQESAQEFVDCVENQEHIRDRLVELDLVAFIADGAILPRESGHSQRPLARDKAVLFRSPDSFRVSIDLPNALPGTANH
jgi:predicted ABC-class ATPase